MDDIYVLYVHHETEGSYLVSDDGDRESAVWIPKSKCEIVRDFGKSVFEISIPEWLAKLKGLV